MDGDRFWYLGYRILLLAMGIYRLANEFRDHRSALFLPVPWVAPVAAPIVVSLALIGFGLVAANRLNRGEHVILKLKDWIILTAGGLIVVLSFTLDARHILDGEMPRSFNWPIFLIGMAVAGHGARSLVIHKSKNAIA